jgi:hypothetical protein
MKKVLLKKQAELLTARKEALNRAHSDINPQGKLFGLDVFAWVNPDRMKLIATLESMPFPIHLVTRTDYFTFLTANHNVIFANLSNVYLLEDPTSNNEKIEGTVVCSNLTEALFTLGREKAKGIMLIVTSDSNDEALLQLSQFLSANLPA